MSLLNNLFKSTDSSTKKIDIETKQILKQWKEYANTLPKKKEIIQKIKIDKDLEKNLIGLKKLLELEIIELSSDEKKEKELISDLESVEHDKKITKIQKLEQCLKHEGTKVEYTYQLLHQLHLILINEINIVKNLEKKPKNIESLISHLKQQLELELAVMEKIENTKTFQTSFVALVKGEHIIKTMDATETKLIKKIQKGMKGIFNEENKEGITYEWTIAVFNALEEKIYEKVAEGILDQHDFVFHEYVNRPEFVELAREKFQDLAKRKSSEPMINAFVHIFREWFNFEYEISANQ